MTLWNGYLLHTKGTVLLVCFQCVDTLALVSKHAEGMSLRCIPKGRFFRFVFNALIHWRLCRTMPKACLYVVMWFVPSHIVAGMNHRISSRFTRIPRDSTRRLFVEICGGLWHKNLRKNIFVWLVEFVVLKPRHKLAQIFTNYYLSWLWQWVTQIRN